MIKGHLVPLSHVRVFHLLISFFLEVCSLHGIVDMMVHNTRLLNCAAESKGRGQICEVSTQVESTVTEDGGS